MAEDIINSEFRNRNAAEEGVDYDTLLSSAGELGRYQVFLLFATFPFYYFEINVYFLPIFTTEVPQNHWCWIPELENLTDIARRNLAIPQDKSAKFGYSQCQAYDANWTEVLRTGNTLNDTWKKVPCPNGWEYNRTEFPYSTISTDLGWVCDKDSYPASAQTMFFAGSVIGGIIIGWMADLFGRVTALVICNLLGCIGGFFSTFSTNFTQFSICLLIMGMSYDNCLIMALIIALEYMAPKYRSVLSNVTFAIFYALFTTAFPFIALACGHWKTLALVSSLPLAFALLAPLFIPESPRWLLSQGRIDETLKIIRTISRINKKEVPSHLIDTFKISFMERNKHDRLRVSPMEICQWPLLKRNLVLVCLEYACCRIVLDGLIRNLDQLNFDFFTSFAASNITEFPSILLCAFALDYFGRRWMIVISLTICFLSSVLIVFVATGIPSVVCAIIARFAVNMACNTVTQWNAELMPTPVRGFGVAICHMCGNVASMLTPYIAHLKVYIYWLPYVIIGVTAAAGVIIAPTLPETAMKSMPQTFHDAEEMGRNQKFWEIPCLKNAKNESKAHVNTAFELET